MPLGRLMKYISLATMHYYGERCEKWIVILFLDFDSLRKNSKPSNMTVWEKNYDQLKSKKCIHGKLQSTTLHFVFILNTFLREYQVNIYTSSPIRNNVFCDMNFILFISLCTKVKSINAVFIPQSSTFVQLTLPVALNRYVCKCGMK